MPTPDIEKTVAPTPNNQAPDFPPGRLALADGTVFHGRAFGATGRGIVSQAEVVFNTAMCGYQESLTDPSYTGQVLVQTFPLIGNTGVNAEDVESREVQVAGFVVRELARRHSNFRATGSLSAYLAANGVLGLTGVDTRAITKLLRTAGCLKAVLSSVDLDDRILVEKARAWEGLGGKDMVSAVTCASRSSAALWALTRPAPKVRIRARQSGRHTGTPISTATVSGRSRHNRSTKPRAAGWRWA